MALNLWKIGGKPTAYNPLPLSWANPISLNPGTYILTMNASSASSATLRWVETGSIVDLTKPLTPISQSVTFQFTATKQDTFYLYDLNSRGDIVVDSISLVQKPLPKNTINGVDGFLSGKWGYGGASTAPADVTIIDDLTAILRSTDTTWKNAYLIVPVVPNTTYTLSGNFSSDVNAFISLRIDSVATATSSGGGPIVYNGSLPFGSSCTFTTPNNGNNFIMIYFQSHSVENLTWKNVMLNQGSTAAPFEKKRGDVMRVPIAVKNQFIVSDVTRANCQTISAINPADVTGINGFQNGLYFPNNAATIYAYQNGIQFNPLYSYTFSCFVKMDDGSAPVVSESNTAGDFAIIINGSFGAVSNVTVSPVGNNIYRISGSVTNQSGSSTNGIAKYTGSSSKGFTISGWQLEQSPTATPYKPYAVQVNPKPKRAIAAANKGLAFDGNSQYVDFGTNPVNYGSSLSIEIDAYIGDIGASGMTLWGKEHAIKIEYLNGTLRFLTDLGSTTWANTIASCNLSVNARYKIKATYDGSVKNLYVNDTLMASVLVSGTFVTTNQNLAISAFRATGTNIWGGFFIGVIYSVKFTVDGNVLQQVDFTNPNNVVGNTVLVDGQQNLVPFFDSGLWAIGVNANAKIFGKDYVHTDPSSSYQGMSAEIFSILPATKYLVTFGTNNTGVGTGSYIEPAYYDINNTKLGQNDYVGNATSTFTTPANTYRIHLWMGNGTMLGSFDFIKPKLYQLTGNEGTINGNPVQRNKPAKRNLYAKR